MNVNSLVNKLLYFRHLISEYDLCVTAVCETWLVPSVSSSFASIDGCRIVYGDGSLFVRNHGCCLCVRVSLPFVFFQIDVDLLNNEAMGLTMHREFNKACYSYFPLSASS